MGFCNCSMFCCALLCIHSSFAIILIGKREPVALLGLSSWCLVIVVRLFLTMPPVCLQFVIVVFPDHTQLQSFNRSFKSAQLHSDALFSLLKDDYTVTQKIVRNPFIFVSEKC